MRDEQGEDLPLLVQSHGRTQRRALGATAVFSLVYFNVCGGPWGSEEIVSDAGPLPGLVGLALFPVLW